MNKYVVYWLHVLFHQFQRMDSENYKQCGNLKVGSNSVKCTCSLKTGDNDGYNKGEHPLSRRVSCDIDNF